MSVSQGSKILASDCVSTNTASTLVLRDGSGNFDAGRIKVDTIRFKYTDALSKDVTTKLFSNTSSNWGINVEGALGAHSLVIHRESAMTQPTNGNSSSFNIVSFGSPYDISTSAYDAWGRIKIGQYTASSSSVYKHMLIEGPSNTSSQYPSYLTFEGNGWLTTTRIQFTQGSSYQNANRYIAGYIQAGYGPANTEGFSELSLGNTLKKDTAYNASGKIILYNSKGNTGIIKTYTDSTTNFDYSVIVEDTLTILSDQSVISTTSSVATKSLFRIIPSMRYHKTNSGAHGWTDALNFKISGKNTPNEENYAILELGNSTDISYPNNLTSQIQMYNLNGKTIDLYPDSEGYLVIKVPEGTTSTKGTFKITWQGLWIGTNSDTSESHCGVCSGNGNIYLVATPTSDKNRLGGIGYKIGSSGSMSYWLSLISTASATYWTMHLPLANRGTTSVTASTSAVTIYSGAASSSNDSGWGTAPRIGFQWSYYSCNKCIGIATNNLLYIGTGGSFSQIALVSSSSRTIKHNIQNLPNFGEMIDKLNPVSFIYNSRANEGIHYGLIYEDTKDILPDVCKADPFTEGGAFINYTDIIPVLIKEIQSLRRRTRDLETQLNFLTKPNILQS